MYVTQYACFFNPNKYIFCFHKSDLVLPSIPLKEKDECRQTNISECHIKKPVSTIMINGYKCMCGMERQFQL